MCRSVLSVRCLLSCAGLLFATASRTEEETVAPLANESLFDIRGNIREAAIAETRWAVRVLKDSKKKNSVLAKIWPPEDYWWAKCLKSMSSRCILHDKEFKQWGRPSTRAPMELLKHWLGLQIDSGLILTKLKKKWEDITEPNEFALMILRNDKTGFKSGMDQYILDLQKNSSVSMGPQCEETTLEERYDSLRDHFLFEERGRIELDSEHLQRSDSRINQHAGIAQYEDIPEEAKDFFREIVYHGGKSDYQRSHDPYQADALFDKIGAPFIAGASGSIQSLILSMEAVTSDDYKNGTVPCKAVAVSRGGSIYYPPLLREAVIALFSAILIAGGQHSLAECLVVAQMMGYFKPVPKILANYTLAAREFEKYVDKWLGLKGDAMLESLDKVIAKAQPSDGEQRH